MNLKEGILSKENSKVLRGLAITAIALHNYFHIIGFSEENEMSFSLDKTIHFFEVYSDNTFAELFSFLGWLGVPVFIFLTGYGIATHTPPLSCSSSISYIKKSYLKLLALMIPAVLFFAGLDVIIGAITGDILPRLLKRFSYLTLMTNFAYPYLRCDPGVYWYFSLTFQFYLLWALFGHRMNGKSLFVWSVVFIMGLWGLCLLKTPSVLSIDAESVLSIYRHCFTGWFFVFAFGIWSAQSSLMQRLKTEWWLEILLLAATGFLMAQMNRTLYTWLFVPIVGLAFFVVLGMIVQRIKPIRSVFHWLGGISAYIFVCHPIARTVLNQYVTPHIGFLFVNVGIYLLVTILISLIYRWFSQQIAYRIIK